MSTLTIPPLRSPTRKPLKYPFPLPISLDPSCVLCLLSLRDSKWYDFSGKGNHGLITGATWTAKGRHGPTLYFDALDDYVNCGKDASLNITKAITLAQWLYPLSSGQGGYGGLFSKGGTFTFYMYGEGVEDVYGSLNMGGQDYELVSSGGAVSYNHWHHVVWTYDGSAFTLYVDTVIADTLAASGDIRTYPNNNLKIGDYYSPGYSFHGYIDESHIYKRALSPSEIKALYEQGLALRAG